MGKAIFTFGVILFGLLLLTQYRPGYFRTARTDTPMTTPMVTSERPSGHVPRHVPGVRAAATETEEFPDPPQPTNSSHMTSADWNLRNMLVGERSAIIGQLRTDEELLRILSPVRSYAERAHLYCLYHLGNSTGFLAGRSLEKLRARYQSLLVEEPETAEGEQQRQMKLQVVTEQIAGYLGDLQTCEGLLVNGYQQLHTNDEIRDAISRDKARIAEIDHTLVLNGQ